MIILETPEKLASIGLPNHIEEKLPKTHRSIYESMRASYSQIETIRNHLHDDDIQLGGLINDRKSVDFNFTPNKFEKGYSLINLKSVVSPSFLL